MGKSEKWHSNCNMKMKATFEVHHERKASPLQLMIVNFCTTTLMPFHMQFLISYSVALGLLVSFCYCIVPKSCKLQKIDEEGGSCQFVAFSYQRLLHEKSNNSFFFTYMKQALCPDYL